MFYEGTIYRPPSEAMSLILQITVGCRHNQCTFCSMYKGKSFRIKAREEIFKIIEIGYQQQPFAERIFLADGDALTLDTELLLEILDRLNETFPRLKRIGIYGGPKDILEKSPEELTLLRQHGLGIVYLGVESGSSEVLQTIHKGVTPEAMIAAGQRIVASEIKLSCTIILGLGGSERSQEHALETAKVLTAIDPQYLGALTLMIEPEAPLARHIKRGNFKLLTPREILQELYLMIKSLEVTNCVFRSNHASNYLPLKAQLPTEKNALLGTITRVLNKNQDESLNEVLRPEEWRGL